MLRIVRPLFDPGLEYGDLLGSESLARFTGRHAPIVVIGQGDARQQFAGVGLAGYDRTLVNGNRAVIQAQLGLLYRRSVAFEALVREDRPDVASEVDRLRRTHRDGDDRNRG